MALLLAPYCCVKQLYLPTQTRQISLVKPLTSILSSNLHLWIFLTVLKIGKKRCLPRRVISCSCCTLCLSHTMGHCLLLPLCSLVIAPIYINIINFIFTLLASKDEWTYKWMHFSISRKSENLWQALFGFRLSVLTLKKRQTRGVQSWVGWEVSKLLLDQREHKYKHIMFKSNNTNTQAYWIQLQQYNASQISNDVLYMEKCAKWPTISHINLAMSLSRPQF